LSVFFVDTSALAKRYVPEIGTKWVRSWIVPSSGHHIVVSDTLRVEMLSLLARHRRLHTIPVDTILRLRNTFLKHYRSQYRVIQIDPAILLLAGRLVDKYPLRTLDALQLACAIKSRTRISKDITFISADNNLLLAAVGEGFSTDNPNSHP
jgi:uncharacterized protein